MRVLIDTNIFIYREDEREISTQIQELMQLLNETRAVILIHPASVEEIKNNPDERKRGIMLSKIKAYSLLEAPPNPSSDPEYLSEVSPNGGLKGSVDNILLYAIFRNAVNFFITEDRGIHKKATKLRISEKVLLITEAINIFRGYSEKDTLIAPPALRRDFVYNLNPEDPIFDSLKRKYTGKRGSPKFIDWINKVAQEGRKCFVYYQEKGRLGAVLIYKIEDEPIPSTPPLPKEKRLKLSTFIVATQGLKIGELFLKLAVDISIKNQMDQIYLTHFTESEDRLVDLLTEYGFFNFGKFHTDEDVYLKYLIGPREEISTLFSIYEFNRKYYPSFYDGPYVSKFLIPIQPMYHERLFTDMRGRQTKLVEHDGAFFSEGNAIKKAYITRSKSRKMNIGDVILFYKSRIERIITSLGIVEDVILGLSDSDQIYSLISKRTVYSRQDIEWIKKPVNIILFKHHFHLPNPVKYEELLEKNILSGPLQSITELTGEKYLEIKRISGINERFTVN